MHGKPLGAARVIGRSARAALGLLIVLQGQE
jgi:hypothetical protein